MTSVSALLDAGRLAVPRPVEARLPVVLATADDGLRDAVERLAAAAGVGVTVVRQVGDAFAAWVGAGAVVVGADLAAPLARLAPDRRQRVCVVSAVVPGEEVLRAALRLGAMHVFELGSHEAGLAALLADLGEPGTVRGLVVGVLGGSGGVGATTLACALGQIAPTPAVVVEVDPFGPGVDRVLGMEQAGGLRWPDLAQSKGRLNGRSLREALPCEDGLATLTYGSAASSPDPTVLREVLAALRRGHESVVIDLPRPDSPMWEELAPRCEAVVVVADGSVTGVSSAGRMLTRLPDLGRARVVLRPGAGDPGLVAAALGVPVVAEWGKWRRVGESIDLGYGPIRSRRDRIARVAESVWGEVSGR